MRRAVRFKSRGDRTPFFSPPRDRNKAAWYATKYLAKFPKQGYPTWVLDRVGRMPRYGHSHRFFPRTVKHDPLCMCLICLGEAEPPPSPPKPKKPADDIAEKRLLLEIIGLNWTLDGVNLVPQMRKPFDLLAEGLLVSSSRGDRRFAFPNDMGNLRLFWLTIAQTVDITADAIYDRPKSNRRRQS